MIIYNSILPKIFQVNGVTIYPFIFIKYRKEDCPEYLLNHEQIHMEQQLKYWIIPFYIIYLYDYLKNRLKGMNHNMAYRNIEFEIEAYNKQYD